MNRSQQPERGKRISVLVPGSTANLGPGLDSLGLALTLYNRLTLEEAETDELQVSGEGERSLLKDQPNLVPNLVLEAIDTVFQSSAILRPPIRLKLENGIPLARGLGSSAAARIGGLVAARLWCSLPDDPREVLKQAEALEGHADNAASSLLGGLTVVAGTADTLQFGQAAISEKIQVSVAIPDFEVVTSRTRMTLPTQVPHSDAVFNVRRTAFLMAALAAGDGDLLALAMQDKLHQPHRAHLMGPLGEACAAALKAGAAGAAQSGAGPTVIAFSIAGQANSTEIAEAMAALYWERDIGCRALTLGIDIDGAHQEERKSQYRP